MRMRKSFRQNAPASCRWAVRITKSWVDAVRRVRASVLPRSLCRCLRPRRIVWIPKSTFCQMRAASTMTTWASVKTVRQLDTGLDITWMMWSLTSCRRRRRWHFSVRWWMRTMKMICRATIASHRRCHRAPTRRIGTLKTSTKTLLTANLKNLCFSTPPPPCMQRD